MADKSRKMERHSKSELVKTIEEQQEKITKYQAKLKDLISAYKGVQKEKDALESSLKALGSNSASHPKVSDGGGTEETPASENEEESVSEKLRTLTSSLTTVMQEKAKMEANYQAEKKQIKAEYESKVEELEEIKLKMEEQLEELNGQLTELKPRLRSQQHEREREQTDHVMMLKEMQKLLAEERMIKEQLEQQVEELKFEVTDQKRAQQATQDKEVQLKELRKQLAALKVQLTQATLKQQEKQSTGELDALKEEIAKLKKEQAVLLSSEQKRAERAEEQLHKYSGSSEDRISQLEAKVSEVTNMVGEYERLRVQDQQTIARLREKINQLDIENTALATATQPALPDNSHLDLSAVMEEMTHMLFRLKDICFNSDKSVEETLNELGLCLQTEDLHTSCRHELEELREEFERYKLRAQSVLKSKHTKEPVNKELEGLKSQLTEYKERLWQLRADRDEMEQQHTLKLESMSKTLVSVQDKHKQDLTNQDAEHRVKMAELDSEMKRHRDRTIALLAEKDKELDLLRGRGIDVPLSPLRRTSPHPTSDQELQEAGASSEQQQMSVVSELLSRTSLLSATPGETSLLHFAQEQARRDVEIQAVRRQKHAAEAALRELQHASALKEEQLTEQVDVLKEEIRKQERNRSRENANMEYLKNVVYHYMVCTDNGGRQKMVNAIATILQFSPKERGAVQQCHAQGWFNYTKK